MRPVLVVHKLLLAGGRLPVVVLLVLAGLSARASTGSAGKVGSSSFWRLHGEAALGLMILLFET